MAAKRALNCRDYRKGRGPVSPEFLLAKFCDMHGIQRRASCLNTDRIAWLYHRHEADACMQLHYGHRTHATNLIRPFSTSDPITCIPLRPKPISSPNSSEGR